MATQISELRLTLDVPPSVNHSHLTTRSGQRIMKPETRTYKEMAALTARLAATHQGFCVDSTKRLRVDMTIFPARLGFDIDNRVKHLVDALATACNFDDKQIDEIHVYRGVKDKNNPRCEVVLSVLQTVA